MQTNYRPRCPQYYEYPKVIYSLDELKTDLEAFNKILSQPHQYAGARRDRLKNKVAKLGVIILKEHFRLGIPLEAWLKTKLAVCLIPDQAIRKRNNAHNLDQLVQETQKEKVLDIIDDSSSDSEDVDVVSDEQIDLLTPDSSSDSEDEEDVIDQQHVVVQRKEIESGYYNPLPFGPKRLTGWQVIGLAVSTAAAIALGYAGYKYYTRTVEVVETRKTDDKTEKSDDKKKTDDKTEKSDDKKSDNKIEKSDDKKSDKKTEQTDNNTEKKDNTEQKQESAPPAAKEKPLTWWNRHSFYDVIVNRCKQLYSQLSSKEIKQAKHRTERHHNEIKEMLHSGFTLEDLLTKKMPNRETPYLTKNEYLRIMAEDHLHDHRSSKIELDQKKLLTNIGVLPKS